MLKSMTGFGRGTAQREGLTAIVEMRSVNSRFCEVSVRQPRSLNEREPELQQLVKDAFARGRISLQVQVEGRLGDDVGVQVDEAAAQAYGRLLERLRAAAGIEAPVGLDDLLRYPEVFVTAEASPEARAAEWALVREALDEAIAGMDAMRAQEGAALEAELSGRIDALEVLLEQVDARAPQRIAEARAKLQERVNELLGGERLDPERLEQEIALLADKLDVTEECVRLRSHLTLFREALESSEPVGRKLNFIAQEINREVNTIGSKANDAEVTTLAVQMKDELEKIREQIENVE